MTVRWISLVHFFRYWKMWWVRLPIQTPVPLLSMFCGFVTCLMLPGKCSGMYLHKAFKFPIFVAKNWSDFCRSHQFSGFNLRRWFRKWVEIAVIEDVEHGMNFAWDIVGSNTRWNFGLTWKPPNCTPVYKGFWIRPVMNHKWIHILSDYK